MTAKDYLKRANLIELCKPCHLTIHAYSGRLLARPVGAGQISTGSHQGNGGEIMCEKSRNRR